MAAFCAACPSAWQGYGQGWQPATSSQLLGSAVKRHPLQACESIREADCLDGSTFSTCHAPMPSTARASWQVLLTSSTAELKPGRSSAGQVKQKNQSLLWIRRYLLHSLLGHLVAPILQTQYSRTSQTGTGTCVVQLLHCSGFLKLVSMLGHMLLSEPVFICTCLL